MAKNFNDNLVLICGESGSGKTASLGTLKNHKGVYYLNCEAGKKPPFKNKFKSGTITDPLAIFSYFDAAEQDPECHSIIIDTATFMMDMFESVYIVPIQANGGDGRAAWGNYSQFFKKLMSQYVAKSTKNVLILAHTQSLLNETTGDMNTMVKVKGALMHHGIEAYFSTIVSCKKVSLKKLVPNKYLNITPQEEAVGFKHVYQTTVTKDTTGERIRGPRFMWEDNEVFIDNDAQHLIDVLVDFYADEA
jgi:hypothetical protein